MSTPNRRFLILHGADNWRPREHWQWWLTNELRNRAEQVLYPQLPSRVAWIAPAGRSAFTAPLRAFIPVEIDYGAVALASRLPPVVVSSDNDPFCPEGIEEYKSIYTRNLGLEHHVIGGAGHISIADGYGPWPSILDWCLNGETQWQPRIDAKH